MEQNERLYRPQSPSKNLHLEETPLDISSRNGEYTAVSFDEEQHADLHKNDAMLKRRIRILKFVARLVATIVSLATLIPLVITVVKFVQTKDTMYVVNGQRRTAWAAGTQTWYTYLYLGIAIVSFVFNIAIIIGYCASIKKANAVSFVAGWWSGGVLLLHLASWIASVVIYKIGSLPRDGKFNDLWGWTCSDAAKRIQPFITNVDYNQYCAIQTSSFYIGIIAVVSSILSVAVYVFAIFRSRSKKRIAKSALYSLEPQRPQS